MFVISFFTGGFITKYINRQLIVIVTLFGFALSMYMTPYSPTKTMFFVFGGLLGFSSGIYDSSQMVWMIEIWQSKAGPLIQAQHFCYAIGAIIPSVIIAPFLDKYDHLHANNATTTTIVNSAVSSTIHIPFLIIAAFNMLALVFQLFLFTFYRYHTPPMYANENFELIDDAKNVPSPVDTELSGNGSINQQVNVMGISNRKLQLIAFATLFLGAYQAMEVSTIQFLPIFGRYSDLKMTEAASAYVLTAFAGLFAIGRLVGIIIIFKVRPELIILVNFLFSISGNVILLMWANDNVTMFWIGSVLLGTGYSTTFPSFCAFIEKYLVFTSTVATCIIICGATTSSIYPIVIGNMIAHKAVVLAYTNFLSTFVCAIVMLWGYKLTRKSVNRER